MSELIYAIDDHVVGIYPELVDAIKCVRAQGIKTALLTNNWLKEPGVGHTPVDKSLFDVVSFLTWTICIFFTDKFIEILWSNNGKSV